MPTAGYQKPQNALNLAAAAGDIKKIRELHAAGHDLNAFDSVTKLPPIAEALIHGNLNHAAEQFLVLSANINYTPEQGTRSLLECAYLSGDADIFRDLAKRLGQDPFIVLNSISGLAPLAGFDWGVRFDINVNACTLDILITCTSAQLVKHQEVLYLIFKYGMQSKSQHLTKFLDILFKKCSWFNPFGSVNKVINDIDEYSPVMGPAEHTSELIFSLANNHQWESIKLLMRKYPEIDWLMEITPHGRTIVWYADRDSQEDLLNFLSAQANISHLLPSQELCSEVLAESRARTPDCNSVILSPNDFAMVKNSNKDTEYVLVHAGPPSTTKTVSALMRDSGNDLLKQFLQKLLLEGHITKVSIYGLNAISKENLRLLTEFESLTFCDIDSGTAATLAEFVMIWHANPNANLYAFDMDHIGDFRAEDVSVKVLKELIRERNVFHVRLAEICRSEFFEMATQNLVRCIIQYTQALQDIKNQFAKPRDSERSNTDILQNLVLLYDKTRRVYEFLKNHSPIVKENIIQAEYKAPLYLEITNYLFDKYLQVGDLDEAFATLQVLNNSRTAINNRALSEKLSQLGSAYYTTSEAANDNDAKIAANLSGCACHIWSYLYNPVATKLVLLTKIFTHIHNLLGGINSDITVTVKPQQVIANPLFLGRCWLLFVAAIEKFRLQYPKSPTFNYMVTDFTGMPDDPAILYELFSEPIAREKLGTLLMHEMIKNLSMKLSALTAESQEMRQLKTMKRPCDTHLLFKIVPEATGVTEDDASDKLGKDSHADNNGKKTRANPFSSTL